VALPGEEFQVDFLFTDARLVVETDSYGFHRNRHAFERDRYRDQVLQAAGYRVVRFTWRQVVSAPIQVAATIRTLLAYPSPSPATR
jgi:very-short-patch-repair endonuclease